MKTFIPILFVMMIAGCGKSDVERLEEENRRMKAELENKKLKSDLEAENKKLKEDLPGLSVVGSYEGKFGGVSIKHILLENGKKEFLANGYKSTGGTWKIVGKEVHTWAFGGASSHEKQPVFKIEPNGDLTEIALIKGGKRTDLPNKEQRTYKKLK